MNLLGHLLIERHTIVSARIDRKRYLTVLSGEWTVKPTIIWWYQRLEVRKWTNQNFGMESFSLKEKRVGG
jgi:hypothetical protein